MKEGKPNLVLSVLQEKCPNCRKAQVFEKKTRFWKMPEMKHACEECGYKFDREPGFFLGAMYLSYALAVLQGIIVFLVCYFFFPGMPTILIPTLIMLVILAFSFKNYKLSRILYIHIFPW